MDGFNLTLDNEAGQNIPCPYNTGCIYLPDNSLTAFDG